MPDTSLANASKSDDPVAVLRAQVADACRILAANGCMGEIVGHVSARIPGTDEMVVRCRRLDDPGVEYTTLDDVKRIRLDGSSDELDGYRLQGEFAIHSEIYRRRPDVGAVVHGHPRASLLCGILELPFLPVIGAYDVALLEMAIQSIPTYRRGILISTPELAGDMCDAMGTAKVCLLQGHGIVTVGADVPDAAVRAIKLESLAELMVQMFSIGRQPKSVGDADAAALLERWSAGASTYVRWTWDYYRRKLK